MKQFSSLQTTKKGIFGVYTYSSGRKVFFKQCNYSIQDEINGYNQIKKFYSLPKRYYYNFSTNTIIYEYVDNLFNKTLHQGLYENIEFSFDTIINVLTQPFQNLTLVNKLDCVNSKFFKQRTYYIEEYLNLSQPLFKKNLIIDGENVGTFYTILNSIKSTIVQDKKVYGIISQGDPTDLNIGINGEITDYEVSGINSAVGEISIFLGCFILNSYYFYIKYVNSPHKLYTKTLEKFKHFINPIYNIDKENLYISLKNFIPDKNKQLILAYLEKLENIKELINNENLGKYIAFRFISPVNLKDVTDEKDLITLIYITSKFEKITSIKEIIKFIKEI